MFQSFPPVLLDELQHETALLAFGFRRDQTATQFSDRHRLVSGGLSTRFKVTACINVYGRPYGFSSHHAPLDCERTPFRGPNFPWNVKGFKWDRVFCGGSGIRTHGDLCNLKAFQALRYLSLPYATGGLSRSFSVLSSADQALVGCGRRESMDKIMCQRPGHICSVLERRRQLWTCAERSSRSVGGPSRHPTGGSCQGDPAARCCRSRTRPVGEGRVDQLLAAETWSPVIAATGSSPSRRWGRWRPLGGQARDRRLRGR